MSTTVKPVTKPEAKPEAVAPVVTVPAPVAPVALTPAQELHKDIVETQAVARMSNGDVKPEAKDASNVATIQAQWLRAEAESLDTDVSNAVVFVGKSIEGLIHAIHVADGTLPPVGRTECLKVAAWKTLGFISLRKYLSVTFGEALTAWPEASRKQLVGVLLGKGLNQTVVASLTGVSEATISRDANPSGTPRESAEESTRSSRLVKQLESFQKSEVMAKESRADLVRVSSALLALMQDVNKRLDDTKTGSRSGAEGTTGTGVNAPKPGAPKPPAK